MKSFVSTNESFNFLIVFTNEIIEFLLCIVLTDDGVSRLCVDK